MEIESKRERERERGGTERERKRGGRGVEREIYGVKERKRKCGMGQ